MRIRGLHLFLDVWVVGFSESNHSIFSTCQSCHLHTKEDIVTSCSPYTCFFDACLMFYSFFILPILSNLSILIYFLIRSYHSKVKTEVIDQLSLAEHSSVVLPASRWMTSGIGFDAVFRLDPAFSRCPCCIQVEKVCWSVGEHRGRRK